MLTSLKDDMYGLPSEGPSPCVDGASHDGDATMILIVLTTVYDGVDGSDDRKEGASHQPCN